ncbi:MAG: methanogenesis marker protein 6 [Candidatus Methanoplasma sp.]|jgi:putative methanogenesis marker protein 6|nr:methanogenesis marker protein 6 [Candidatus Methanoplasma sp.]
MSEDRETRLFMISPDSTVTPDQLAREIHAMGRGVAVKETCYGCLAEGSRAAVAEVLAEVRGRHPLDVFSKRRAYPAGDPRRCRAQHGTRPGYAQLEAEWAALAMISRGLEACGRGESPRPPAEPAGGLPVEKFKEIAEAIR